MSEKEEPPTWLLTIKDSSGQQTVTETRLPADWLSRYGLNANNIVHFEGQILEKS